MVVIRILFPPGSRLAMSDRLTAEFVIRALSQAIKAVGRSAGLIFHSDRGVQYACGAFKDVLEPVRVQAEHEQEGQLL